MLFCIVGFLFILMRPVADTVNSNQIAKIKIRIWIRLVFCIGSFLTISHTHHGQSLAFSLLNRLSTVHSIQIPSADSKNKNIKHITQIIALIDHIVPLMTTLKNIIIASTSPIARANLFCGAQTYSGFWLDTNNLPRVRLGEYLGLISTLMIKSSKNAMTNNCIT